MFSEHRDTLRRGQSEGQSVAVVRPQKSHNSRLFCGLVQRVSLPYLAFSSYPALWLLTFYGPSAPVPPIVLEFSIFGKKLDPLNWCVGQCF